jgi:hypothetical protein
VRTSEVRSLLNRYSRHYEEWTCGRAKIILSGKDENPRFDRRLEIFLRLSPREVDLKKLESLLSLLDELE